MIENVERLQPQVHRQTLVDRERPAQRSVNIVVVGATESVPAEVPDMSLQNFA